MKPARPSRGLLYGAIALAVVSASFGAILVRYARDVSPLAVAAWRLGLTTAILIPFAWIRGTLKDIPGRTLALSAISGVALAAHFVLWIASLRDTTVASSVLFVTTHPLFVALGSRFVLREGTPPRLLLGIVLALGGSILIASGDLRLGGAAWRGDLLALGGGLAVSVYFLLGRVVRRNVALVDYATLSYGVATVCVILGVLITRTPLVGFVPESYAYLALLALGPQLLGHTTFNWALRHLPASRLSVMILGEPIGATLLALVLFGERPSWLNGLGAVIILLGIYLSLQSKEAPDAPP